MSNPRAQTPKVSGIYSQPNTPLTPIVIRHDSEDSVFSDGDISGRSGSDATAESTPGSLSSCTTISTQDAPSEMHELVTNTNLTASSRKRLRFPEPCTNLSGEGEHDSSSGCAHKRAKSVQIYDAPHLSPLHCYRESLEDIPSQRHTRSDSIMQVNNWTSKWGEELSDCTRDPVPAFTPVGESEGNVPDSKMLSSSPLVVRFADSEPEHALRRQNRFHWKNGVKREASG